MNGRMYDPVIGRVLSPDNFVQDPNNAQNYNRYSYCLNNPLKYNDPTGMLISPYYDMNGNFLGVDENGFSGDIFITTREAFNANATNGIADSKLIQADVNTKEFYASRGKLTDNAIEKILTNVIKGTELPYGEGTLKKGSYNVTHSYASSKPNGYNAKYIKTENGSHYFDFSVTNYEWTVENIRGTAIHEAWGHGIKGYANRIENKHHLIYGAQMDSKYWNKSTENYKSFIAKKYYDFYWNETGSHVIPSRYYPIIKKYW